jgi:hypothetical protein
MFKQYQGSRFVVWIRIKTDPHDQFRGFSIMDRELRVEGYEPVRDEMEDLKGNFMAGTFWVVEPAEVYRAIPELKRFKIYDRSWFFPVEFCEAFVRPYDYLSYKIKETKLT